MFEMFKDLESLNLRDKDGNELISDDEDDDDDNEIMDSDL